MSEAMPRRIEILYFEGCPNVVPTEERVRSVIAALRMPVKIELVPIADVERAREEHFLGSPSVRIDGRDLEDASSDAFEMRCRVYRDGIRTTGVPPAALVEDALQRQP